VLLETRRAAACAVDRLDPEPDRADPYFILPALNLCVMYLTQKMTPMPGMDPMQKKMMQSCRWCSA
jgi:membrane protein insertase Oxa1/YidC/SpoIIIJ